MKSYKHLLISSLLLFTQSLVAEDFTENGIRYSILSDTEVKVVSNEGLSGTVTIPSSIRSYSVVAIEHNAFENNTGITSVFIPSTVRSIGYSAFYGCTGLTTVDNQSQTDRIESYVFNGCNNLQNITIPSTIVNIGSYAFFGCSSLRSISLPASLQSIDNHAFKESGLVSIHFPEGVSDIGDWSFEACNNLVYVRLPLKATRLNDGIFFRCNALKSITIPANYNQFDNNSLGDCPNLSSVYYLGTSVPSVSEYAFSGHASDFSIYVRPAAVGNLQTMAYVGEKVKADIPYLLKYDLSTFACDFDVDFTQAMGLEAFVAPDYDHVHNTVDMEPVQNVAAGTGVLLKGRAGNSYNLQIAEAGTIPANNLLKGAVEPTWLTPFVGHITSASQDIKPITANLTMDITTDKSIYTPGSQITFTATGTLPANAKVKYLQGSKMIETEILRGDTWYWTAPDKDFTGYMAQVYTEDENGGETVYATVGIDVSSSWSKFPRYGFLSDFDESKTSARIASEMAFLNRCHINGVQFYDWHYKHHKPYAGMDTYQDIAHRTIKADVIRNYIAGIRAFGGKSMMYNLCYGAFENAAADGVNPMWGMYADTEHNNQRRLNLKKIGWASDIFLEDPGNTDWQNYIVARNTEVYNNFEFDGYHIDQVGDQGPSYDYSGNRMNVESGFRSFVKAMKKAHPDKLLVMNSVSSYGRHEITSTGDIEFCYNEMWENEADFSHFHDVIKANRESSGGLNTVFAAYMNFNKEEKGNFNTPGVLLTDAVIFALGGSHLELGGSHMLCKEYFPNSHLDMTDELKQSIIHYYDFMTAYQNLLRDGGKETQISLSAEGMILNQWPPKLSTVTTYAKNIDDKQVIHLLNFNQADNLSWRDLTGTMPEPLLQRDIRMTLKDDRPVVKVWAASPDAIGGAPVELAFKQERGELTFTVPSLKYWTMIVVEHGYNDTVTADYINYVLKDGVFVPITEGILPMGKAYLQLSFASTAPSKAVSLAFNATTGINMHRNSNGQNSIADSYYYNLQGMKVTRPSKGIYIHQGKKIIIK